MTLDQVARIAEALRRDAPAVVSVFAGRIADTGRDPVPHMTEALEHPARAGPKAELLWASPRELLNIFQADEIGCHIITVTNDHLKKLSLVGKDLDELFARDGDDVLQGRDCGGLHHPACTKRRRLAAPVDAAADGLGVPDTRSIGISKHT